MVLFHFIGHVTNTVHLDRIFLVKGLEQKNNLSLASSVRQHALNALKEKQPTFECISKLENYLPYITALSDQIDKTSNLDMSSKLYFQWTSSLEADHSKLYNMVIFQHELSMVLIATGVLYYKLAEESLEAGVVCDPTDTCRSYTKFAATCLRKAQGIFSFVADTIIPKTPLRNEERPVEFSTSLLQFLSALCMVNAQEILIRGAIEKQSSPLLVSKLCKGVHKKCEELLIGLKRDTGKQQINKNLYLYVEVQSKLYLSLTFKFSAQAFGVNGKYGVGISLLRKACAIMEEIKDAISTVEADHCLTKLRLFVDQERLKMMEELKQSENDNSTIYFDAIPPSSNIENIEPKFTSTTTPYLLPPPSNLIYFVFI